MYETKKCFIGNESFIIILVVAKLSNTLIRTKVAADEMFLADCLGI